MHSESLMLYRKYQRPTTTTTNQKKNCQHDGGGAPLPLGSHPDYAPDIYPDFGY